MRKLILSICLFIVAIAASAQLTPTGGISYTPVTGIDYVFIFNGLNNASINYNGLENGVKWYKSTDPQNFTGGVSTFDNLVDGTGYTFEDADGGKKNFWVIDYSQHKPEFTSIELNNNTTDQCKNVNLNIVATASELKYETPNGVSYTIPRKFKVTYNTLKWESDRWSQVSVDTTLTLSATANTQLLLPAPFCNTTYTLSGDQYAKELGTTEKEIVSDEYTPIAVICHETSILETRDATNEAQRPTQAKQISGSAPLIMQFLSNANVPITQYYKWEIFKDKAIQPFISRTDKDIRNTFTEAGTYKVRVAVSNANACSFSDSIIVTVSESQIKVPNVFTPNGDGYNDEFRVAYKSIISFHCWVYNRWGRLVYEWTDPQKGWDGKIGGKDASPGAYFYIINALGSDARKYKLKGDINLLRGTGN